MEFPTVRAANSLVVDQALRGPEQLPLILERMPKNSPAYGAWNVKKVVVGTGEALLGPVLWERERVCL